MTGELLDELRAIVGDGHLLTDPDLRAPYERDWTGRFGAPAAFVVRPGSTAEVAEVLRRCQKAGVSLTVQGGNTGLVGGGVPAGGEGLLSLRRLDRIHPVDVVAGQVRAGAGATLAAVQVAAREVDLEVGVDLAARDSATVGGMAATNAGGEQVLGHGMMRANVVGLEVVLADGTVLRRMAGLPKDNVGYDLASLVIGSEGTLAVVTEVALRLVPRPRHRTVALVAVEDVAAAQRVLAAARAGVPSLVAAELFFAAGLALVLAGGGRPPFAGHHPTYLVLEAAGPQEVTGELAAAIGGRPEVREVAVAEGPAERAALWHLREAHTEAIARVGVPVKLDVAVPAARLAELVAGSERSVAEVAPGATVITFGHLAEGNLHVNVVGAAGAERAVTDAVLGLVVELGGSVSAEHGVGRAKVGWVARSRSPEEVAAMVAVKRALDPSGLLNPGVILAVEEGAYDPGVPRSGTSGA